jgi:transcription elongation factor Elf1
MSIGAHDLNARPSRWAAIARVIGAALRALAGPVMPIAVYLPASGLHRCPDCGRDRVCPVDWEAVDEEHWEIALRCGECGTRRDVLATNAEAAEYDVVLDRQQRTIERALTRLDAERMAQELERFVRALADDLIDANDFAR